MRIPEFILQEAFIVNKLISFYYHEFPKDFVFPGEEHDFWELGYIDKGEANIFAYDRNFYLKQGDLLFYKPNVYHSMRTMNNSAFNVVNISFYCTSEHMAFFEDKIFSLTNHERNILSEVVNEGLHTFKTSIGGLPLTNHTLYRKDGAIFGSEQLIKIGLEKLLISLIRRFFMLETPEKLSSTVRENHEMELFVKTSFYLRQTSIGFNLDELSTQFQTSKSQLKKLFKEKTGMGIKQYWNRLKIEQAKLMIRDGKYNITQISELLGYNSVHYFSRYFKNEVNMTPTEYAKTVKVRAFSD